jgi:2-oxoglutarate ferredoxin oxidoreductase subunit beta
MKAMLRAIHRSQLPKDSIALVSGIGCSSRTPGYVDFNTLHTTHGRAIAFASGIKLAKPELNIIVVTGDGDAMAIGGNHFIHAARRNIAMTVLLYNNHTYGMTGGQTSPTTPVGMKGSMTPYGSIEPVFDISALAITAGASFVARSTCYHAVQLDKYIQRALANKGFSLIEVLSPCPTYYGRPNRLGTSLDMMRWYKENSLPIEKARTLKHEETQGKVVIGILHDVKRPEYSEEYYTLIRNVKKA